MLVIKTVGGKHNIKQVDERELIIFPKEINRIAESFQRFSVESISQGLFDGQEHSDGTRLVLDAEIEIIFRRVLPIRNVARMNQTLRKVEADEFNRCGSDVFKDMLRRLIALLKSFTVA